MVAKEQEQENAQRDVQTLMIMIRITGLQKRKLVENLHVSTESIRSLN